MYYEHLPEPITYETRCPRINTNNNYVMAIDLAQISTELFTTLKFLISLKVIRMVLIKGGGCLDQTSFDSLAINNYTELETGDFFF